MIPDAAIEAAHKAWREQAALDGSIFEYNLRAAIEAVAPRLIQAAMAEAWEEAYGKGRERGEWEAAPVTEEPVFTNPYR